MSMSRSSTNKCGFCPCAADSGGRPVAHPHACLGYADLDHFLGRRRSGLDQPARQTLAGRPEKDSADGEAVLVFWLIVVPPRFVCVQCGYENHADVVGTTNLLSRRRQKLRDEGQDTANALAGIQVDVPLESAWMACGSSCSGGRKQEPAETTMYGAIHA
jgi:hypothetical protein